MTRKLILLFALCALTQAAFAQAPEKGDFWVSVSGDGAFYATEGFAYGGGLALGYGSGSSIGIKAVWFFSSDSVNVVEVSFILRLYFNGAGAYTGPFIQFMGGPTFYSFTEDAANPYKLGMISAGLCLGWRFLFADRWFIEPNIRAGYPYISGAAVSAGIRF